MALIVSDGGEPTFRYYRKTCCVSIALVSLGLTQPEFGWPVTYPSLLRTVLERSAAPFGVIVTARVPSMRQIHRCPKLYAHNAVPILPAMHECSNPGEANLVVIAMVVLVLELEHHEQIADRRAVHRQIGIVFVGNRIGKMSRLRALSGSRRQLRSMNFRIETWSA